MRCRERERAGNLTARSPTLSHCPSRSWQAGTRGMLCLPKMPEPASLQRQYDPHSPARVLLAASKSYGADLGIAGKLPMARICARCDSFRPQQTGRTFLYSYRTYRYATARRRQEEREYDPRAHKSGGEGGGHRPEERRRAGPGPRPERHSSRSSPRPG